MPALLGAKKRRTRLSAIPLHKLRGKSTRLRAVLKHEVEDKRRDKSIARARELEHRLIDRYNEKRPDLAKRAIQITDRIVDIVSPLGQKDVVLRFDLRIRKGILDYIGFLEKDILAGQLRFPELKQFAEIAKTHEPIYRKGHVVFAADFRKYPQLQNSPGRIFYGMIVVDSNIPAKFRNIIVDHEIREEILDNAGYEPIKVSRMSYNKKHQTEYKRGHLIAVQREKRDLQRREKRNEPGLMNEFLEWARQAYPELYKDRKKRWRQKN